MERLLEFDTYTDRTAPEYGYSLRTVYTTLIGVSLVVATIALARTLENSPLGALLESVGGAGGTDLVASVMYVPVMFALFVAGRYAGVRGVDTGDLWRAAAGVAVMMVVYALAAVGFLEIVAATVTDEFYLYLGGMLAGVVVLANAIVLVQDWDLSVYEQHTFKLLHAGFWYVTGMAYAWNRSTDGAWWDLYRFMRWGLLLGVIPAVLFTFYIYDAWRNAERGLGPTFDGLATYVAISSTVLFPIDLLYLPYAGWKKA